MGQKRKHKEEIPAEYTEWRIANAPIQSVLEIGKYVAATDYAVRYYKNKKHPKFYKNDDEVRRAVRRAFAQGAFNHREQISTDLYDDALYLQFAETKPDKRKTELLKLRESWNNNPCLICTRADICDELTQSFCSARPHWESN